MGLLCPPAVKQMQKHPYDSKGDTHTRLPGGRQDFKLHAEGKVRLRESTEKLRLQQVPMNLKLALTAVVTLCPAETAGCFDRCGHVKA